MCIVYIFVIIVYLFVVLPYMNANQVFGPISKEYCLYFYILSVIGLVLFAIAVFGAVYVALAKNKGLEYFVPALMASLAYFIAYLQNRLLYNMCAKTL